MPFFPARGKHRIGKAGSEGWINYLRSVHNLSRFPPSICSEQLHSQLQWVFVEAHPSLQVVMDLWVISVAGSGHASSGTGAVLCTFFSSLCPLFRKRAESREDPLPPCWLFGKKDNTGGLLQAAASRHSLPQGGSGRGSGISAAPHWASIQSKS